MNNIIAEVWTIPPRREKLFLNVIKRFLRQFSKLKLTLYKTQVEA